MNCEDIKALIIEYIDGALNNKDAQRVNEHLASCKDCRAELTDIRSTLLKLDNFEMEQPSVNLRRNFQSMIETYSLGMNNSKPSRRSAIVNWLESWWPRRPLIQFITTLALLIIGLVTGLSINGRLGSRDEIAKIKSDMNPLSQVNPVVLASLLNHHQHHCQHEHCLNNLKFLV